MSSTTATDEVPAGHYALDLAPERSFHGVLTLRLPSSTSPPLEVAGDCSLHALFAFAPELIIDPYQLSSDIWIEYYGHGELELPAVKADGLGTGLRAHLDRLAASRRLEIKVDGRYLAPAEGGESDSRSVNIDLPWVGWVCAGDGTATAKSSYIPPSPFPLDLLGNATLHPLQPVEDQPHLALTLPVGRASHLAFVESATVIAVWACAGWVAWKAWQAYKSSKPAERIKIG